MLFLSIVCGIINLIVNFFTSVGFEIKNAMTRGTRQWILIAQHISKMGVEQVPWLIATYKTHCTKTK
jgi:hypothetical protein